MGLSGVFHKHQSGRAGWRGASSLLHPRRVSAYSSRLLLRGVLIPAYNRGFVCSSFQFCHFSLCDIFKVCCSFFNPFVSFCVTRLPGRAAARPCRRPLGAANPRSPSQPWTGPSLTHVDCTLLGAGGAPLWVPRALSLCSIFTFLTLGPMSFHCLGPPRASALSLPCRDPVGLPLNSSFLHGGCKRSRKRAGQL